MTLPAYNSDKLSDGLGLLIAKEGNKNRCTHTSPRDWITFWQLQGSTNIYKKRVEVYSLSNQIRLGKPQYKLEEPSWGLLHIIIVYITIYYVLYSYSIHLQREVPILKPCFDNKQQKLQQWIPPCLTYFFLNFSWFNKQLGNEKHNYSTSMFLEVLLWRFLLGFFCLRIR